MKKILTLALSWAAMQTAVAGDVNLDLLKSSINPGAVIKSVKPSAVPGLYEVQINSQIVYLTEDGEKVISGDLYDLKQKVSYTDQARNKLRKTAMATVKTEDKVVYQAQDEKYKVAVFTDITCPYCSKLHEQMQAYNEAGITIEYLAFPRAGIGSQPQKDMQKIWCSADKALSLNEAKKTHAIPTESCDGNQVVEQFLLGQDIGVNATPTLIFSDGEMKAGYIDPTNLLKILQQKFPDEVSQRMVN